MSRAPPFPTSNRSGQRTNGSPYNPVQPLALNRPPPSPNVPNTRPGGGATDYPVRPMRSDLRQREPADNHGVLPSLRPGPPPEAHRINRDSVSTTYSEPPAPRRQARIQVDMPPPPRGTTNDGDPVLSPGAERALDTAMRTFSSAAAAGNRRRAMEKGGVGDIDYEREEAERRRRERERADRERRDRMRAREVQQQRGNRRRGAGDIDAVLDEIQGEWEWVTKPDFNPVELALSLLDDDSQGKDMGSFSRTKNMLEHALKGTIEQHSQTFAAALPHHGSVLTSLSVAQKQIAETKSKLLETSESFDNKRADLVQLWQRSQALDEMMKILDEMDHLKSIPDALESLISEKKLLQASVVLLRGLKMIGKSDMQEIGALADLRAYMNGQETTLREILVDELQSHIWLKTFWCDSRWAAYTAGQHQLPTVEFDEDKNQHVDTQGPTKSHLSRFLFSLTMKPNDAPVEASGGHMMPITALPLPNRNSGSLRNPESDSFSYIEMLLEGLAVLGKLGSGLDTIAQRLPIEIYSLVEATIDEVNDRTEFSKRLANLSSTAAVVGPAQAASAYIYVHGKSKYPQTAGRGLELEKAEMAASLRLAALESSAKEADHEVLRDLFWTLYSKLDAVMQSLRVVYEVANRIGARRDFRDSSGAKPGSLFPLNELWIPIQSELQALLLHYLTPEENGVASGRNLLPSVNDVLRDGRVVREKGRPIFRFGDADSKLATRTLRPQEEELNRVLKDAVPGLVSASTTDPAQQSTLALAIDERFASAVQHRLIVSPDAFHIPVVFHPTLVFLERTTEISPSGIGLADRIRASSGFLEVFVLKIYLPLLQEKVQGLFLKAVTGPAAFLADPTSKKLSSHPLVKASTELVSLINSLCAVQRTTPFHRDDYSRLILSIVMQFYQRCSDRFMELVSTVREDNVRSPDEQHVAVAARWAQRPEVTACISALWSTPASDVLMNRKICRQETRVELNFLTTDTVTKEDLVPSKNLKSLGNLYLSLKWFMRRLTDMKILVEDPLSPVSPEETAAPAFTAMSPGFPVLPPPVPNDEELKLPLTKNMAMRFDALMKTYEQLAEYVLASLRIDTRCRTIHFLDLAMRRGNYRIDRAVGEPDPHIIDLNTDLSICDEFATATLPPKERRFVFEGLGTLMEHLLISNSRHIRFVNAVGIQKIMRNMLAMQQNLKTITDASQDADFEKAKAYWNLFSLQPAEMLSLIKQKPLFSFEEYKSMLNFRCGVDQALGDKGASQATDKDYNMYLIELHALAIGDLME